MTAWPMPRPRRRPARAPRRIAPGTNGATDLSTRPGELADECRRIDLGQDNPDELDQAPATDELAELMGLDLDLSEPAP